MTYKVYMTIELRDSYDSKDAAMDAAAEALQNAVTVFDPEARSSVWQDIASGAAVQARVFEDGKVLSGEQHAFVIDIHDGAI
jgi:hypothetical protein